MMLYKQIVLNTVLLKIGRILVNQLIIRKLWTKCENEMKLRAVL